MRLNLEKQYIKRKQEFKVTKLKSMPNIPNNDKSKRKQK